MLTSIFGGSLEEYVAVAKCLAPFSDGLELNLSCPHAKGFGMAMGQDPELVFEIIKAVKAAVDIPVIPKLTPNTDRFGDIVRAACDAGADALCAVNTVGPGYTSAYGHPVLSNGAGGMSGKGILPIALKWSCAKFAQFASCPSLVAAAVSSSHDVLAMQDAGASIIGVGSALTGMTTADIKDYFKVLASPEPSVANTAESKIR